MPRFLSPSSGKSVSVRAEFTSAFIQDSPKKKAVKYVIPKKSEYQNNKAKPAKPVVKSKGDTTKMSKNSLKSRKNAASSLKQSQQSKSSGFGQAAKISKRKSSLLPPESNDDDTMCEQEDIENFTNCLFAFFRGSRFKHEQITKFLCKYLVSL